MNRIVGCCPSLTSCSKVSCTPGKVWSWKRRSRSSSSSGMADAQASCTGSPRRLKGSMPSSRPDLIESTMCCSAASACAALGSWPPWPDSAAVKTMAHGGPARAASAASAAKLADLGGRLVHAHQRREFAAFAGLEAGALRGAGAGRQFGAGKDEEQLLRLGLGARGLQQVVEALDVHRARTARLLHQRRVGAVQRHALDHAPRRPAAAGTGAAR